MDSVAVEYVKLVLALGVHDAGYVDAYYGPDAWKQAVEAQPPTLERIAQNADALLEKLGTLHAGADEMALLRRGYLQRQLQALAARVRMLRGESLSFDEESRALYDAVAPVNDADHFERIIGELDSVLPGTGPVAARYAGTRADVKSWPSGTSSGSGIEKSLSYICSVQSIACAALTQWIVPWTLRPSGALPPLVAGYQTSSLSSRPCTGAEKLGRIEGTLEIELGKFPITDGAAVADAVADADEQAARRSVGHVVADHHPGAVRAVQEGEPEVAGSEYRIRPPMAGLRQDRLPRLRLALVADRLG